MTTPEVVSFDLGSAIDVLGRTPGALQHLLGGIGEAVFG